LWYAEFDSPVYVSRWVVYIQIRNFDHKSQKAAIQLLGRMVRANCGVELGKFDITNDNTIRQVRQIHAASKIPSGGFSTGDARKGRSPRVLPFVSFEGFIIYIWWDCVILIFFFVASLGRSLILHGKGVNLTRSRVPDSLHNLRSLKAAIRLVFYES
jgi:hypothetical protein